MSACLASWFWTATDGGQIRSSFSHCLKLSSRIGFIIGANSHKNEEQFEEVLKKIKSRFVKSGSFLVSSVSEHTPRRKATTCQNILLWAKYSHVHSTDLSTNTVEEDKGRKDGNSRGDWTHSVDWRGKDVVTDQVRGGRQEKPEQTPRLHLSTSTGVWCLPTEAGEPCKSAYKKQCFLK